MSAPAPAIEEASEQFESIEQQRAAAELGMWVFLATELMFFARSSSATRMAAGHSGRASPRPADIPTSSLGQPTPPSC